MLTAIQDFFERISDWWQSRKAESDLYHPLAHLYIRWSFGIAKRESFYEQLYTLLNSGVALYDALTGLREKYLHYKSAFRSYGIELMILNEAIHRMDAGLGAESMSQVLHGLIPKNEETMFSVDARRSTEALEQVRFLINQFSSLRRSVLKMMISPITSLLVVIALIVLLNDFLFPMIMSAMSGQHLPAITMSLYHFCHFFAQYSVGIGILFLFLIAVIIYSLSMFTGPIRHWLNFILPYNVYKQLQASAFLISLNLLMQSGEDFTSALSKLEKTATPFVREYIERGQRRVARGDRPGEALSAIGFFNRNTQIYIDIFDKAQSLEVGLQRMADKGLTTQIDSIQRTMSGLSTFLLAVVVAFSSWFYLAVGYIGFSAGNVYSGPNNSYNTPR